jgi:hypothetical protein
MADAPETVIRTSSLIEAALLVGNGCPVISRAVNRVGMIEFDIAVPQDRTNLADQVRELCGSNAQPGVGPAMRQLRDDVYEMTGKTPKPEHPRRHQRNVGRESDTAGG